LGDVLSRIEAVEKASLISRLEAIERVLANLTGSQEHAKQADPNGYADGYAAGFAAGFTAGRASK
jgi:flagellar biosynthesis/type III secretory pathway protein FliH